MIQLIICGPGYEECLALEKAVHKALIHLSMEGHVSHLDIEEAKKQYGAMKSPALVVNGNVVLQGKTEDQSTIEHILKSYQ